MSDRYKIAHITQQGVDLVIVPLDDSFEFLSERDQQEARSALQRFANGAGLAGTVVPVWNSSGGRVFNFIAPHNWAPFFRSINMRFVFQNINRELICG